MKLDGPNLTYNLSGSQNYYTSKKSSNSFSRSKPFHESNTYNPYRSPLNLLDLKNQKSFRENCNQNLDNSLLMSYSSRTNKEVEKLKENLNKANEMISLLKKQNSSLIKQRDSVINQLKNIEGTDSFHKENQKDLEDLCNLNQSKLDVANANISKIENENRLLKNETGRLREELDKLDIINNQNSNDYEMMKLNFLDRISLLEEELSKQKERATKDAMQFKTINNDLRATIRELNGKLTDEQLKYDKLLKEINIQKKIDNNTKRVLEDLFNFFNKTKLVFSPKEKKEILKEVIEVQEPEELRRKLEKLADKIAMLYLNYNSKFGKCFPCDIGHCTSSFHRLKVFSGK